MTAIEALTDAKKEQIKLRATFLNNIGVGIMLIGVFTPITRVVYGDMSYQLSPSWLIAAPTACFVLGITLHSFATWMLKELSK
jgi:hypothetical protein